MALNAQSLPHDSGVAALFSSAFHAKWTGSAKQSLMTPTTGASKAWFEEQPITKSVFARQILLAFFLALSFAHSGAQILHSPAQAPTFEVATIKPSPPDAALTLSIRPQSDDRFAAMNSTVKALIEFANTTDSDRQIVGLSGWTSSERYDINAKVSGAEFLTLSVLSPTQRFDQYRLMQQSLLVDRFHMKVHFKTR